MSLLANLSGGHAPNTGPLIDRCLVLTLATVQVALITLPPPLKPTTSLAQL